MSVPLLGPFRLTARSFASPAGVVYSGLDPAGSPLQVVVMTRGAASDAAARDRFAAAVRDFDGLIVASDLESTEPWAAGGPGLERTLEPILFRGRSRGPQFLPYWAGAEDPAFPSGRSSPLVAPKGERPHGVIPALITLLLMAILLGGLLGLLFACQPEAPLTDDNSRVPPSSAPGTGGENTPPPGSTESPQPGRGGEPTPTSGTESPSTGPQPTKQRPGPPSASGGASGTPDGPNGQDPSDGGDEGGGGDQDF